MLCRTRVLLPLLAVGTGLAIAQSSSSETDQSLLASAKALYDQSHYPEAIDELERAEALARRDKDIPVLLEIKQVQANALRTLGRTDEALRVYEEWFRLNRQLAHPQPEGRATRFLSVLYREMGDTTRSETTARRALALAREEENVSLEAGCLLSIGALYKDRGRYAEAIRWHQQALVLAERAKLDRLQAEILNSLGDAEHHARRLEDAERDFRASLEIAHKTGYLGLEAQVTARTGEVDAARGRYEDAIDLFARATEVNHQLGDPLTKVFSVELEWARAERAAGHAEKAIEHYRGAITKMERLEALTVPSELERALPVASSRAAYEEAADLLVEMNRSPEGLELADSGRARAFVDLLNESHIDARSGLSGEERNREEELERKVAEHRDHPAELARALTELEDFYIDLRRSSPAYAELRHPGTAKIPEIQRELAGSDTAFVEYLLGAERSHVWVVTNDGVHQATLDSRKHLEPLVNSYRRLVSEPVTKLTPEHQAREIHDAAARLYRLLLAPIEPYIDGKRRLLIVPDLELANVPFESFLDRQGRFLIEKHAVVYSQSASASLMLAATARERPRPEKSILVFGDPLYDGITLAPIPYTREEATAIADLFPSQQRELRLGKLASESALKTQDLDRFGYLHFAVHGLVDDSNPARSGLALSRENEVSEDGVLRAEEIARLRLNALLVVLSGCRTGYGKLLQGEGMLAISRSFYYAGARAVVATLWNVDDVSTTQFMKSFYAQIKNGLDPEDALRQAKIQMARGARGLWANPWFWSPFIIFK